MLNRLEQLKSAVDDLGVSVELHVEQDGKRIAWRFRGTDPNPDIPSIINASGSANTEDDAIRDIIAAAHEQLWEGVTLEAPEAVADFPAPDEKLSDWGIVDDPIPPDLAQLVTNDETLGAAVERMTPGLDELLQMAELLSETSLEQALSTIPPDRVNEWTERLNSEKGELRTKRGTVDENLERENLINRVVGTFTRVGAKR